MENRYVAYDLVPHAVNRVVLGTGMGMIPSCHISDACLFEVLERQFILKPSVRRKYNAHFYVRFRDDIIMIVGNATDLKRNLLEAS